MLKPQLDQAMRSVTQAPLPQSSAPPVRAVQSSSQPKQGTTTLNGAYTSQRARSATSGVVHNVSTLRQLDTLLSSASKSCAVIFFTSSTCPPCKVVYPTYDELAAEAGPSAVLIKVDINLAHDVGQRYNVRATPTFITFLKGEKESEWLGADPAKLRGSVRLLLQMAQHPHTKLDLPLLHSTSLKPITFGKVPPLDKLMTKMGPTASQNPAVQCLKEFISARSTEGAREATLPDVASFASFLQECTHSFPSERLFPLVDLLRAALVDPRFSGYFAEEAEHRTVSTLFQHVNQVPVAKESYALRLTTLQAIANLFTTPLFPVQILTHTTTLTDPIIQLTTSSLLDVEHTQLRVAASSLAFNIAVQVYRRRVEDSLAEGTMAEEAQVELLASLIEAVKKEEESKEALRGMLLALAFLVRETEEGGELWDVCGVMDGGGAVIGKLEAKEKGKWKELEGLIKEVGKGLLGKGMGKGL